MLVEIRLHTAVSFGLHNGGHKAILRVVQLVFGPTTVLARRSALSGSFEGILRKLRLLSHSTELSELHARKHVSAVHNSSFKYVASLDFLLGLT